MIPIHGSEIEARVISEMYGESRLSLLNLDTKFARETFIYGVHGNFIVVPRVSDKRWYDVAIRERIDYPFDLKLRVNSMHNLAADLRKPFGDTAKNDQVGLDENEIYSSSYYESSKLRFLLLTAILSNCPGDQVLLSLHCLHPALKDLTKGYKVVRNHVTNGLVVQKRVEGGEDVEVSSIEEIFNMLYRS